LVNLSCAKWTHTVYADRTVSPCATVAGMSIAASTHWTADVASSWVSPSSIAGHTGYDADDVTDAILELARLGYLVPSDERDSSGRIRFELALPPQSEN